MGHYAAEMQCDKCGNIHCKCVLKPDNTDTKKWIVETENNYTVIQVGDYDKKYATLPSKFGPVDGMPLLRRCKRKHFDLKSEAQAHAKQLIEEAIFELKKRLHELESVRSAMK